MAAPRFLKTWVKKGRISWRKIEPNASVIDANVTTQRLNSFEIKKDFQISENSARIGQEKS